MPLCGLKFWSVKVKSGWGGGSQNREGYRVKGASLNVVERGSVSHRNNMTSERQLIGPCDPSIPSGWPNALIRC